MILLIALALPLACNYAMNSKIGLLLLYPSPREDKKKKHHPLFVKIRV
jgi:hypothetical protein